MAFLDDSSASAKTITLENGAAQESSVVKFGQASLALQTGSGRRASVSAGIGLNTDFDFRNGSGQVDSFTMEFHLYLTSSPSEWSGMSRWAGTVDYLFWWAASGGTCVFEYYDNVGGHHAFTFSTTGMTTGVWYHLAIDASGTGSATCRLYLDGVVKATNTMGLAIAYNTFGRNVALKIGSNETIPGVLDTNGYIDNVRITKGVARYAGAFTPPVAAYGTDVGSDPYFANVVLLAQFDGPPEGIVLAPLTAEGWVEFPTYGAASLPQLTLAGYLNLNVGEIGLPQLTLAGSALRSYPMDGAPFLPEFDSAGSLEPPLALPLLTLAATGLAGNVGDGALALPKLLAGGSLEAALRLPQLVVAGSLLGGAAIAGDVALRALDAAGSLEPALPLPALSLAGVLVAGNLAQGAALLEALDATAVFGTAGAAVLPLLTLTGTALAGNLGLGDAELARLTTNAVLYQNNSLHGAAGIEPLTAQGTATSIARSDGDARLAQVSLTAEMLSGNVSGAVTLELPLLAVDADGFASAIGTATLRLPLLAVAGSMVAAVAAPQFAGVVLHTRVANAVTTYSGADFNSLCNFNGMLLAASSTGIYALRGETDAGLPIAAVLASGVADFQSEQFKRVLGGYAGYNADGDLELTITTDGAQQYVYALAPRRPGVLHAARVKFGRGVDGRYWQWRLSNRAGAAFALDALTLDAVALSRRIG